MFLPILLLLSFPLAGSFVLAVTTYDTFLGCYNYLQTGYTITTAANKPTTPSGCAAACGAQNLPYSAYLASTTTCYCGNNIPTGITYSNNGAPTACNNNIRYNYWLSGTTMQFKNGYISSSVVFPSGARTTLVSDAETCFRFCMDLPDVSLAMVVNSQSMCTCAAPISGSSNPSYGETRVWTHVSGTTSGKMVQGSVFVKRQQRERLERQHAQQLMAICPHGLTACLLPQDPEGFECIDVQTELESCGGCVFGQYGNTTAPLGEDCTVMGSETGTATCVSGVCQAYQCTRGYKVGSGRCG